MRQGSDCVVTSSQEFKNTVELHSYLIDENRRLQEYLNSLPMSLVDMIKSGKLRPPQEINACQFCLRHYKNEQEG
jgi:hypothetical protein